MIKKKFSSKIFIYFLIIYLFILPKPASAYIDPGTGSYLFQLLVAGLLGGSFFIKSGIKKIRRIFQRKSNVDNMPIENEDK